MNEEQRRLHEAGATWKQWGPYLAERAWGTVREDYSSSGDAWNYFPHEHACARAYRWNEDGLAGICDEQQRLCFALALWNGKDSILKERLFGLTNGEGSHGEDVKECYYYLDSTPSHSYMEMLYKYPQAAFPYDDLRNTNRRRSKHEPEYELLDTGIFAEQRYFDVFVTYARISPDDVCIRINAINRGPEAAELHLIPQLWFRNTWAWGYAHDDRVERPALRRVGQQIVAQHSILGEYTLFCQDDAALLFTENDSNLALLFGVPNATPYVKDAFHRAIVAGECAAINPAGCGTKAAAHHQRVLAPGESWTIYLRLCAGSNTVQELDRSTCERIVDQAKAEADAFYHDLQPSALNEDERRIQRQAFAGMLWSKQFYYYDVAEWRAGDPGQPPPPPARQSGRNREWEHLNTADILSMPDTWEYPWFAAWDLAFHCIPLALLDAEFAKQQLVLLGREWYQHPNGQVPAYEWNFSDVNPPVLAWATWRVYKIDQRQHGHADRAFLERCFHKLLLNFTWWINRKDADGRNVFQGGFLGLDNIGVFDRSAPLPNGGHLDQSDGTAWMGMFCLNMLTIALELARENLVYQDIATKFLEHFLYIADALNHLGGRDLSLWDEEDEFFYDVLRVGNAGMRLKIRSMVGLVPLFAVTTIEPGLLEELPEFKVRLEWFLEHRPHLAKLVSRWQEPGLGERRLLALCRGSRMKRLLRRALDENEFLSEYGVRALSKYHAAQPYTLELNGSRYEVRYLPGESDNYLFGGNSNWRGPIWFPMNYLLIEALQQYHHYYGDDFRVECPTGSGQFLTLSAIADELSQRLIAIFRRDAQSRRAVFGNDELLQHDPQWRDYLLFFEYFHGDDGHGIGASHQTGWTGLVAKLLQQQGNVER
jgi:hypothetical protein